MYGSNPRTSVRDEATIVLSGIGNDVSDDMLSKMYGTYGPLVRISHNGTNSAHVIFAQKAHALKAVKATNGAVVHGQTVRVSLQRPFQKSVEPCRGFAAGICRRGDMCKYYHVTDNAAFAVRAPPVVGKTPREPKIRAQKSTGSAVIPPEIQAIPDKKVCRHFSRGYCSLGEQCNFAHVLGLPKQAIPPPIGKVARPCLFFQNGVCSRGDACRYVHEPIADAAAPACSSANTQSSNSSDESDAEPEQKDENRTCIECEKPGVAVWKCVECDNSLYCEDCNSTAHRARVMAKHNRTNLPPLPESPRCGECELKNASVRCEQCEVPFCASCDACVHKFKSLRKHVRVQLFGQPKEAQPNVKEPQQEVMAAKKKKEKKQKVHVVEFVPQAVPYVESVPLLEFSSDSASESEDEEMEAEVSNCDEPTAAADPSEAESDEDFDDAKPPLYAPVIKAQTSHPSNSESEDGFDDMTSSAQHPALASKESVSSRSNDDFQDEALFNPAAKLTPARKPSHKAISSDSESDSDDEAPPILVVKKAKKLAKKTKVSPGSSNGSKHEVSSKQVTKKKVTPARKSVKNEAASSPESSNSLSTESLDSSGDKASALKSTTHAPLHAPVRARDNKAGGISVGSSHTLVNKIEAYNESSEAGDLHLDATLNGFERLLAHDCAERLGLTHESIGSGLDRHIIISRHGAKRPAANAGKGPKSKKNKHRRV